MNHSARYCTEANCPLEHNRVVQVTLYKAGKRCWQLQALYQDGETRIDDCASTLADAKAMAKQYYAGAKVARAEGSES